jgi:hypothetical protein
MHTPRRQFLIACGLAPFAAALAGIAKAAEPACGGEVPLSQKNRRRTLGYLEESTQPQRRCGLCTYFTAGEGGCGTCQMLSGGAVNANGVCNYFVARPR